MGHLQWMLLIFSVLGLSAPQSFRSPPPDISSLAGVDVYLPCDADLGNGNNFEWLEHITDHAGKKIYDSRYPNDIQGGRQDKFAVNGTKPSSGTGTHNLIIKNAQLLDGGTYSARITTAAEITARAEVIIFEDPSIQAAQKMYENRTEEIRCSATFGAPTMNVIKDSQKPRVEILVNNLPIQATERYVPGDPGKEAHELTMTANLKVTWEHRGQILQCSVSTSDPSFQRIREQTLDVKFFVRDIQISPSTPPGGERLILSVGEHLNCTANGNDEPVIQWLPQMVPTVPPGGAPIPPIVTGPQLLIRPNMIGENEWECQASNQVGAESKTISSSIKFTVGTAPVTDGSSQASNQASGDPKSTSPLEITVDPTTGGAVKDEASVPLPRKWSLLAIVLTYLLLKY